MPFAIASIFRGVQATRGGKFALPVAVVELNLSPNIPKPADLRRTQMHGIIYLVGFIVIVLAILSFFGLR